MGVAGAGRMTAAIGLEPQAAEDGVVRVAGFVLSAGLGPVVADRRAAAFLASCGQGSGFAFQALALGRSLQGEAGQVVLHALTQVALAALAGVGVGLAHGIAAGDVVR